MDALKGEYLWQRFNPKERSSGRRLDGFPRNNKSVKKRGFRDLFRRPDLDSTYLPKRRIFWSLFTMKVRSRKESISPLTFDRKAFGLEIKAVFFFHFVESPPGYSPKQPQNKDCGDRPGQNGDPEAILRKAV